MQQVYVSAFTSLVAAELLLILVRTREIIIIAKSASQRTAKEQAEIGRGLARSLVLEAVLFVPVSVLLLFLTVRPILVDSGFFRNIAVTRPLSFDALIGSISYGFPFAVIRRIVTTVALQTLKNFAEISIRNDDSRPTRRGPGARSGGGVQ